MIRSYKKTDELKVIDVWYKASTLAHSFLGSDFMDQVKKDMSELYLPNADTWIYEEENTLIGFISMLGNEIGGLFVLPSHHSKGIGTQLVNYVHKFHKEIEVEVFKKNRIGRAFYDKYGFKLLKEYFHAESNNEILRMKF